MAVTLTTRIGPGYLTTPTFEAMRFPAGEAHIKVLNENDHKGPLTEIARISGADGNDLMTLAMWADAAHQRGARTVAHMPYLPGARQDRGLPFGASVYADLINSMDLGKVICFDPHSPVMPDLINNLTVIDSAATVRKHVVGRADSDEHAQRYNGIICPDAGAVERTARIAAVCHLPVYQARKHRDEATGQLSGFTCEDLPAGDRYLIADDICDAGGTFLGLAAATGLPASQLGLYVSHGVFSNNAIPRLLESYAHIYTTDSYNTETVSTDVLTVIPLNTYLTGANIK